MIAQQQQRQRQKHQLQQQGVNENEEIMMIKCIQRISKTSIFLSYIVVEHKQTNKQASKKAVLPEKFQNLNIVCRVPNR